MKIPNRTASAGAFALICFFVVSRVKSAQIEGVAAHPPVVKMDGLDCCERCYVRYEEPCSDCCDTLRCICRFLSPGARDEPCGCCTGCDVDNRRRHIQERQTELIHAAPGASVASNGTESNV